MLVLTAVTAVQRFVKVWRQASIERPVAARAHRRPPVAARARPAVARVASVAAPRPQRRRTPLTRASPPPERVDRSRARRRLYKTGSRLLRTLPPAAGRAARRVDGSRVAVLDPSERRPMVPSATCARSTAPTSPAPTLRPRPSQALRVLRPLLGRVVPPAAPTRRGARRRASATRATSTSSGGLRRRQGRDPRPAAPRRLGVGGVLAGRPGLDRVTAVVEPLEPPELFEWFADLPRALGHARRPARPDGRADGAAGAARQPHRVPAVRPRHRAATASRSTFFGERTTLPAGPATLGAAHRRAAAARRPSTSGGRRPPRRRPPAARRRRARAGSATTRPDHPGRSPTSSRR